MSAHTRLTAATWGWLIVASLSTLLLVAAAAAGVLLWSDGIVRAWSLLLVGWPITGGLLVARRPANPVGRLLVAIAASFALSTATDAYLSVSLELGALPATDLVAWLSGWILTIAFVLIAPLVAVFPSGRVASAWLRWPLRVLVITAVVAVPLRMIAPQEVVEGVPNPWGAEAVAPLIDVANSLFYLVEAVMVLAFVDLVLRWRRSHGIERLQMRWLALALVVFALLLLASVALRVPDVPDNVLNVADTVAFLSGLAALPVAIGVAVARYRLYEIERLLSRTVTYTLIVVTLAAVYTTGVFVLRSLLRSESDLAVAASTVLVAALFNPLRRRVQLRVDRRFNRTRYDTTLEMERFAGRLRSYVDGDDLIDDLVGVVARTVQPTTATVWLRGDRQ